MPRIKLDLGPAGNNTCIKSSLTEGCCRFLRVSHFGKKWTCLLFRERQDLEDDAGDGTGRLLRWPECMAAGFDEVGDDE